MKPKPPVVQLPQSILDDDRHWHDGADIEVMMYARSLHQAAKTLIGRLSLEPNPKTAWDACPLILLYRTSVELQLKVLVDEGGVFLKEPTEPLSLAKTHSLRWLAQIVCQIIRAVRWEDQFKCEGVASLADFSALVNELEELDPVAVVTNLRKRRPDGWVPDQLLPPNVVNFAKRLDALLGLLESTTDDLAATADLLSTSEEGQVN